jgi:hypothetical protein
MSSDARLILRRAVGAQRWHHRERGDYDLERFDREVQERLYSDEGREILRARELKAPEPGNKPNR